MTDQLEMSGRVGMNARSTYALERGWTVKPHPRGRDHDSDRYIGKADHVWRIADGWRRARFYNGRYNDHQTFACFEDALTEAPSWRKDTDKIIGSDTVCIPQELMADVEQWLGKLIADGGHRKCVMPRSAELTLERVSAARRGGMAE